MSSTVPALPGSADRSVAGPADAVVDPAARPVRRSFSAEYRARVVAEYEINPSYWRQISDSTRTAATRAVDA